jgi:hypothetical protein
MRVFKQCWTVWLFLLLFPVCSVNAASGPTIRLERVPEEGLQPQALVDSKGTLHLIYLNGDPKACDVQYVRRPAGQSRFSTPLRVNSKPRSALAIGTVRGAQIALGRDGRLYVAWNGSSRASTKPSGAAAMLFSRMTDSGDAFEPQRDLMTSTTHLDGGGSVAADNQGRVYVVWHGHRTTGPQEEIDRGVFMATSTDDGKTFANERQINSPGTGVCGCCGLKAFADIHGCLAVLYRSANLAGNRDSVLLLSTNFGASFTTKVLGEWHVSTCPMSTHELGMGPAGLTGMWEKGGQVYLGSISSDLLDSFTAVAAGGLPKDRKHPTFTWGNGKNAPMLIAWTEGTGWEKGGSLAWECLDSNKVETASGHAEGVPVWSYAAAVVEKDGSFVLFY